MSTERTAAPRRRARRVAPKATPTDLYDYAADPEPRSQKGRRAPRTDKHDLPVYDDWPDLVPVTEEEVDVFERYFGDLLDRLFGGPLYSKLGENNLKIISENDMDKE
ncbi:MULTISPECIES: hypothetical protein [Alphaproteobacteria]|uniref:Uncharacterized protein n=2 Tax=Alphaproteobacteria TaxID=28211 RepID=A0A2S7J540_9HYPH|nr:MULTISPECIES: hypothetical protein [Alphaproteobacteria]AMG74218.1 hypothetical protein SGRAN_1841 [Sphingopyxis granuli]PQA75336.1 hypothetical protein C3731_01825 [Brucella oryzae]